MEIYSNNGQKIDLSYGYSVREFKIPHSFFKRYAGNKLIFPILDQIKDQEYGLLESEHFVIRAEDGEIYCKFCGLIKFYVKTGDGLLVTIQCPDCHYQIPILEM